MFEQITPAFVPTHLLVKRNTPQQSAPVRKKPIMSAFGLSNRFSTVRPNLFRPQLNAAPDVDGSSGSSGAGSSHVISSNWAAPAGPARPKKNTEAAYDSFMQEIEALGDV